MDQSGNDLTEAAPAPSGARPQPYPVSFEGNGLVLRGDRWDGEPGRTPVLFLHGGGQTRHSWGRAAAELAAAGWPCTTLDLRGHGESDWSATGEYVLSNHVADISRVAAAMGSGIVLVGASLGGLTALTLAGSEPGVASALVLVDIVPRTSPEGVRRIGEFMRGHLDGFPDLDAAADAVAAYNRRPRPRNVDGLKKNLRLHDDGRWYWHWDPKMMAVQPSDEPNPGISPERILDAARNVTVPVLVVRGGNSDVVDDAGVEELLAAVPDGSVVTVSGAGHMVAGDDNDLFTASVRTFLERLTP